jgi:hypothetical protein
LGSIKCLAINAGPQAYYAYPKSTYTPFHRIHGIDLGIDLACDKTIPGWYHSPIAIFAIAALRTWRVPYRTSGSIRVAPESATSNPDNHHGLFRVSDSAVGARLVKPASVLASLFVTQRRLRLHTGHSESRISVLQFSMLAAWRKQWR